MHIYFLYLEPLYNICFRHHTSLIRLLGSQFTFWMPWYNWNIVESGVKHHKPQPQFTFWPPRYNWNINESGVKHHKPQPPPQFTFNCCVVRFKNWISSVCFFSSTCLCSAALFSVCSHFIFHSLTCFSKSLFSCSNSVILKQKKKN